MIAITIDLTGDEDLARKFAHAPKLLRQLGERLTRKVAKGISASAQRHAPVRTGLLRSSIDAWGGGLAWWAGVPAGLGAVSRYSIFVEYGTSKMAAQPYMRPAAEEWRGKLDNEVRVEMAEVFPNRVKAA